MNLIFKSGMRVLRRRGLWLIVILACLWGCEPHHQSPSARKGPAQASAPLTPPDRSLRPGEYIKLGLPPYDRPWSGKDTAEAADVLANLAATDAGQLPRYQSERSGEVFARLAAIDQNLAMSRDKSMPVLLRVQNAGLNLRAANHILKLYSEGFARGKTGGADVTEIMGGQLPGLVIMATLVDEAIPTLDKADPGYEAYLAGLEKSKQDLAMSVVDCLQTLSEKDRYQTSDRLRLLHHMEETLPLLIPRFSAPSRQEVVLRLDTVLNDPRLEDIRPGLKKIKDTIDSATSRSP